MSSVIKIKKSSGNLAPNVLGAGELAYSWDEANSFAGGKLWIGAGAEIAGEATNILVIGGKYFTDMLDHVPGVSTPLSALVVDAHKKLDNIKVDNIDIDGNTIATTNANGDLYITPAGAGKTVIKNIYVGSVDTSLADYIASTSVGTVTAGTGIQVSVLGNEVTISGKDATSTEKGIASFSSTDFVVTSGSVALNTEAIQDLVGLMVGSGSVQSGISVSYNDTLGKLDFNVSDPTVAVSGDATGSAVMTNLGNVTVPVTLATVNANVGTFGSATQVPVFTVNGKGLITSVGTASIATTLTFGGTTGAGTVSLLNQTFTISGGNGLSTSASNQTLTVSAVDATTTVKGVASFNTNNFTVSSGAVSAKTATIGSTSIALGSTATSLAGLQSLAVDNITIDGNTLTATNTNGDIVLTANGAGNVIVSNKRIRQVAEPVDDSDAATKYYVDAARSGLTIKESVKAATTGNIALTGLQTIDGVTINSGDRVLVKDQTNPVENGLYTASSVAWVRTADADTGAELKPGTFVFVQQGTINSDTGFVVTSDGAITVGTSQIQFTLFSSSGTLIAGAGLVKNGYTLELSVSATGGLEVTSDQLQLKSSVAGGGLTYTSGVIAVGGTSNRITVNADSIDIASTYVGQASITTLGTVTTGTWNASVIEVAHGGTGLSSVAAGRVLFGSGGSALSSVAPSVIDNSFLRMDATGSPYWSNVIDGGTY